MQERLRKHLFNLTLNQQFAILGGASPFGIRSARMRKVRVQKKGAPKRPLISMELEVT